MTFCVRFQAQLTCLSRDIGQTKLNNGDLSHQATIVLRHKDIFTIGDRSFRWEYPDNSRHLSMTATPKKAKKFATPTKTPSPGRSIANKGANLVASPRHKGTPSKKAKSPKKTPKSAKKTPKKSPKKSPAKTPRSPSAGTPTRGGSKRVSFGPYISPEYIDKNMPPSTPVRRGATPTKDANVKRATPSSLLKRSLIQQKAAQNSPAKV